MRETTEQKKIFFFFIAATETLSSTANDYLQFAKLSWMTSQHFIAVDDTGARCWLPGAYPRRVPLDDNRRSLLVIRCTSNAGTADYNRRSLLVTRCTSKAGIADDNRRSLLVYLVHIHGGHRVRRSQGPYC